MQSQTSQSKYDPQKVSQMNDARTQEELQRDSQLVTKITESNFKRFGVTPRIRAKKQPTANGQQNKIDLQKLDTEQRSNLLRMLYQSMRDREAEHREKRQLIARFDDEYDKTGFCVYTDNINDLKTPSTFDLPVITLSGMPSFTYEWSKLESAVGARWINFLAPGLDGFDERNRTPSVRLDSFALEAALLLKRLLNKLNIKKAVIFAHSFAIYLLSGIINFMPERVAAVGMFGTGQMTSENHLITSKQQFLKMLGSDINQTFTLQQYRTLDDDNALRQRVFQEFEKKDAILNNFESMVNMKGWLSLDFNYISAANSSWKEMQKIPKFFAAGKNDIFMPQKFSELNALKFISKEWNTAEQCKHLNEKQKAYLFSKKIPYSDALDFENMPSNFSFVFEKTGHSVHLQRAEELITPIRVFLAVVDALNFENGKEQPKL